jgi:N-acetylmuramoyl-L-alanine amidase CwlA
MAFLKADKTRTFNGILISEKLIKDGSKLKPNKPLKNGKVEWITIHNTPDVKEAAGTNDAEQYARATHNGNMGGVSVHYYIDETGCWQLLREDEMGYHAADGATGPGNSTSLAIEIIMDGSGDSSDKGAEARGAKLAAGLLHKYGLPVSRLTTHQHWYPKKYCPAYILPHWGTFVNTVKRELDALNAADAKAKTQTSGPVYRVQIGAFTNKANAEAYVKKAKAAGFDAIIV